MRDTAEPTSDENREPTISLVVPVFNEAPSLSELYSQISVVLDTADVTFELIFVDDGSSDSTACTMAAIAAASGGRVRGIRFAFNRGKASALAAGFYAARGAIIVTMDGDLQDDPKEIPRFLLAVRSGHDLVCGWKVRRKDSLVKNSSSKFYNVITSLVSGVPLHDHNCGFKAYRREVAISLPLTGQLHRYIPMLASALGFTAIAEIGVNHRTRPHGKSKYGLSRFLWGITGLCHAIWIVHRIGQTRNRDSLTVARALPDGPEEYLHPDWP